MSVIHADEGVGELPALETNVERPLLWVHLTAKSVLRLMIALTVLFIVLNLLRIAWMDIFPHWLHRPWSRFDLDREDAIPTWFSSIQLLTACLALSVIAVEKRRSHNHFARHWIGLAVIFLLMSVDEVGGIHELLIAPLRGGLGASGPLYFAWVIPGGLFVIGFVVAYLRFLGHLNRPFRRLFILSGGIYVFGALCMEMVGGEILTHLGHGLLYEMEVTVEEGCEMLGASLFIYTLLTYLRTMTSGVSIVLAGRSQFHASRDREGAVR